MHKKKGRGCAGFSITWLKNKQKLLFIFNSCDGKMARKNGLFIRVL